MGTGSKDESGSGGAEADAWEPSGLSATASASPTDSAPRAPRAPGHQQAVELVSSARRYLREGNAEEAKQLFRQAAEWERQVLRRVEAQPERSLVAEYGARAALQGGRFSLAKEFVRKGSVPPPSEQMQWSLLCVAIEADLLEFLEESEHGWEIIPWHLIDGDESRIVMTSGSGRRFVFLIDPEVDSVAETTSTSDEVTFVLPAAPLDTEALKEVVARRLRPRRRVQPVLDQRGLMDHYLLDFAPA
jgi:hypothetical protein